jgi:SpoVK/Ycf46/Vps4 family AAA+-type ATPase
MANTRSDSRRALQRTMDKIIAESQRNAAQVSLPGLDRAPARGKPQAPVAHHLPDRIADLVYLIQARRRLSDLVLRPDVVEQIEEFIDEFTQASLLRSNSLEPRHTLLLVGPPGNGKTSLAEAMAAELSLPLLTLRYDAIVDSFLGETSNRLRKLIDYATDTPCVLFFDEFDAVGKERNDVQETGEIKRVVSSLLVQMDRLPSHTLVICATNHPELLDRAVWRRFEVVLEIGRPDRAQLKIWFERFEETLNGEPAGITADQFADYMAGQNMSAVEAFTLDVRRRLVLSKGVLSPAGAIEHVMKRGKQRLNGDMRETDHGERAPNSPPAAGS